MESLKTCYFFLAQKKRFVLCTALTLLLSYGFYAAHYTVHIDQLVPAYYDGTLLVNAGRWSAALIHLFTGWMDFAPFWHTAVMCICLLFASVLWALLFSEASGGKLSEPVLTVFGAVFVSYPVLMAQLTFPVLNIALSYALVPLALRSALSGFTQKQHRGRRYAAAFGLLIFAVDMYESFAGVYLVGLFGVCLLLCAYHGDSFKCPKDHVRFVLHAGAILLFAVAADLAASKLINLAVCGTTEYWYGTNEYILWFRSDPATNLKRLICSLIATYAIGSFSMPFVFYFVFCAVAGTAFAFALAVKRRSALPFLLYAGLFGSSMALVLLVGASLRSTQMQTLPVFVAFVTMLLFAYVWKGRSRALKAAVACILIVIVFSQTKTVNNYAVENYERYTYEASLLQDVGKELLQYDTSRKPVAFYAADHRLPESLRRTRNSTHPLVKLGQDLMFPVFDRVLPEGYFERMRRYAYPDAQNAADIAREEASSFPIYTSFLSWADFEDNFGKMMARLGYSYPPCSAEQKEKIKDLLTENDPTCRYKIIETDDMILVQFMTV